MMATAVWIWGLLIWIAASLALIVIVFVLPEAIYRWRNRRDPDAWKREQRRELREAYEREIVDRRANGDRNSHSQDSDSEPPRP